MTKTLRINPKGETNYEPGANQIKIRSEKTSQGYDLLVEGLPEEHVLLHLATLPIQRYFVVHKPKNDKQSKQVRVHFEAGHTFQELEVKSVVAGPNGELTIHYKGNGNELYGNTGQLYFPPKESALKPTNTIGGMKVTLDQIV
ncbi:hypothetical protein HY837_03180 [archaeon]|nr:hypothetical protein [archaeon]